MSLLYNKHTVSVSADALLGLGKGSHGKQSGCLCFRFSRQAIRMFVLQTKKDKFLSHPFIFLVIY